MLNSPETAACAMLSSEQDLHDMAGCATALLGWVVLLCISLHGHTEGSAAGKGLEDRPSSVWKIVCTQIAEVGSDSMLAVFQT